MDSKNNYAPQWKQSYGIDRDPIRQHIIYPLLRTDLIGRDYEIALDVGCGNGGLFKNIDQSRFGRIILSDVDEIFISEARKNTTHPNAEIMLFDLNSKWPIADRVVSVAFSVFVLNEIENIGFVFKEYERVLADNADLIVVVTHPSLAIYWDTLARERGSANEKLLGNHGYFDRAQCRYKFNIANATAVYYQHTFGDYMAAILQANFAIERVAELTTDAEAFLSMPSYWDSRQIPKYLYLRLTKKNVA